MQDRSLEPSRGASHRSGKPFIDCSKSLDFLGSRLCVPSRQVIVESRKAVMIADTDAKLRNPRDSCAIGG